MKSQWYAWGLARVIIHLPSAMERWAASLVLLYMVLGTGTMVSGQTAVWTYHYDNNRTGWNSQETVLTPANVNASFRPAKLGRPR